MLRGDIVWAHHGPGLSGEAIGRRPAVIVSNNGVSAASERDGRGVVTIVPVTTNVRVMHRFQVLLPAGECGLPETSKAQIEQIRAVSIALVGPRIGTVPPRLMQQIDDALRLHLAL